MLGGLKAALAGSRRGPVLPLSGVHVVHSGPFGPEARHPLPSDTRLPDSGDEETPAELLRCSPPGSPKEFCEKGGTSADAEAGRASTASTVAPPGMGSGMSPPTTASSASRPATSTGAGSLDVDPFRFAATCGSTKAEARLGLTQIVISLDLDIMGPKGLLAQLGLPAQHELQAGALRIQCNSMEVHHRAPDSARTAVSGSARNRRPATMPAQPCPGRLGDDTMQGVGAPTMAAEVPQQFYIGDAEKRFGDSGKLFKEDFAKLLSCKSSRGTRGASLINGSSIDSPHSSRSHESTGVGGNVSDSTKKEKPSGRRAVPFRPSASEGSLRDASSTSSMLPASASRSRIPDGVRNLGGSGSTSLQEGVAQLVGKPEEIHENLELKKNRLRLEQDLYEHLQALEEENTSSSSTPCLSRIGSPTCSPKHSPGRPWESTASLSLDGLFKPTTKACGTRVPARSLAQRPDSSPSQTTVKVAAREKPSPTTRLSDAEVGKKFVAGFTHGGAVLKFEHGHLPVTRPVDGDRSLHPHLIHHWDFTQGSLAPSAR